jgi:hypothetical protein
MTDLLVRRRLRCYWGIVVAIVAAAFILAEWRHVPYSLGTWPYFLNCGMLFGTLYTHPALAGAWTVLGRGRLWARLLVAAGSLVFLTGAYVSIWLTDPLGWFHPRDINPDYFGMTLVFQSGQWLLAVLLVAVLVAVFKLQLVHPADPPQAVRNRFSMRQMLIAMTLVGGVLAMWRGGWISLSPFEKTYYFLQMFAMFGVCGTLGSLPLAFAILVPTRWKLAVVGALVLAVIAGSVQLLIGHYYLHCLEVETACLMVPVQLTWTGLLAGLLRYGGFRLTNAQSEKSGTMTAGELVVDLKTHHA